MDGTVFDFRKATPINARVRDASDAQIRYGRGYDHNWVVSRSLAQAPRVIARVEDPVSGRVMEVLSRQPGIQFYLLTEEHALIFAEEFRGEAKRLAS